MSTDIPKGVRVIEAAVRAAKGTASGELLRDSVGELVARVGRAYCELLALAMVRAPASDAVRAQVEAHIAAAKEASDAALGLYYASHRQHGDTATRAGGDLAHDGKRTLAVCTVLAEYIVRPVAVADAQATAPAELPAEAHDEGKPATKHSGKRAGH